MALGDDSGRGFGCARLFEESVPCSLHLGRLHGSSIHFCENLLFTMRNNKFLILIALLQNGTSVKRFRQKVLVDRKIDCLGAKFRDAELTETRVIK